MSLEERLPLPCDLASSHGRLPTSGIPIVLRPSPPNFLDKTKKFILWHIVMVLLFFPIMLYLIIFKFETLLQLLKVVNQKSIALSSCFKSQSLIEQAWNTEVGKAYAANAEYQMREGFCGMATLRNVLNSLAATGKFPKESVPAQKSGPMVNTPTQSSLIFTLACSMIAF